MHLRQLQPASGWVLDLLVFLETHLPVPGVVVRFALADPRRRQAIAAHLAQRLSVEMDGDNIIEAARSLIDPALLLRADPRELVEAAFGDVPTGYVGALGRSGPQPFSKNFYGNLHALLAANGPAARVLRQLPAIDPTKLAFLEKLPRELHIVPLIQAFEDEVQVRELVWTWRMFERGGVAGKEALDGLKQAAREGDVSAFLWRWAHRLPFPPSPVPASSRYQPIRDGRDLRRIALEWRNCAKSMLVPLLSGVEHLGVLTLDDGARVLVHIRADHQGYRLLDAHGYRNRPRDPEVIDEVESYLTPLGVHPRSKPRLENPWHTLRIFAARCGIFAF